MIIFDFDGTIANSTHYHKVGWEKTLAELGITNSIGDILPYKPNLKERFDSYRRLQSGLIENKDLYPKVRSYLKNVPEDQLLQKVMDLKESYTINEILSESLSDSYARTANNLLLAVDALSKNGARLGVISSTRESIVAAYLYKVNLLDAMDIIIGEESMTDKTGQLVDKPAKYAHIVLESKTNKRMRYYIGDNDLIDREFAENCGSDFVYARYEDDFLHVINKLKG